MSENYDALFLTPAEVEAVTEPEAAQEAAEGTPEPARDTPAEADPKTVTASPEVATASPEAASAPAEAASPFRVDTALIEQAEAVLAQIEARRNDLAARYERGEISFSEYRAQDRTLDRHQREADGVILQGQIEARVLQQRVQADWGAAVTEFRADPANAVFESEVALPLMKSALDSVRAREPNLTAQQQLHRAKRAVQSQLRALLGMESLPAPSESPATAPSVPRPVAPPTLGVVPTVDSNGPGEFAHLDRLTGIEYEKALSRLNPDQRERYLIGA